MSVVKKLTEKGLIQPPGFLATNVHYETIMGSFAYGVSSDTSDMDVYGWAIPPKNIVFPHLDGEILGFGRQKKRFDQFQQHHVEVTDELGGQGRMYDLQIYNIVKYFALAMENNPNMVDSLFTDQNCILHITQVGNMVRERRRDFLHKGCWAKLKGYAYSQLHKMSSKNPKGKRLELREKYGFDCYDDSSTEFLTDKGWKKFDDVTDGDLLGTVVPHTGKLEFQAAIGKISKSYSGNLYSVNSYLSKCVVTENHNMLISPAHRNPGTNYSYEYFPDLSKWEIVRLSDILHKRLPLKRTWFHVRRGVLPNDEEHAVSDNYLALAGLYLSEGSIQFRNGKVKNASISQTENGKPEEVREVMENIDHRFYEYEKEGIWCVGREMAECLYEDFGHNFKDSSGCKRLPPWVYKLSYRQMGILWNTMCVGDGSRTTQDNGSVLYTASHKLASEIQAAMVISGHLCSIRGPYEVETSYGCCKMFQVYRPDHENRYACVGFSRVRSGTRTIKHGYNIEKTKVENHRVVCFEVPNGTLITRCDGNIAIQGNCKFAYHVVRLLSQAEQILTEGDLDLREKGRREHMKAVRRGEVSEQDIREWAADKEKQLEKAYHESKLPWGPDEGKIKQLLLDCLEHHYGNLEKCIVNPDEAVQALKEVQAVLDKHSKLL